MFINMAGNGKNQNGKKNISGSNYLNKNCWLIRNLNYAPYKRCQYCELKFRNCLFLQYQTVSLFLVLLFFSLFLLIEKRLSALAIITVFTLIIVYGYFFNKSTENIIKANFFLKKAKEDLKELADSLEEKVDEQTSQIREKNKYLKELLEMKTDFLRVVNHQLNTPLSVMRGYFSMMMEENYPVDKAIPSIKVGLDRISQTVADFWDAYELEGERMKMEPQKVDITSVVDRFLLEKQKLKLAVERRLTLSVEKPNFKVPPVWCDLKKIAHVISNLLDNAVFYTEHGSVTVHYELVGDNYLKVNVKDTGSGISQADSKKLFKKFSRGSGASGLHPDGSGLGLYIARKIIGGNFGEMTYFSDDKSKGSTFSFTLPIYKNQKRGKDDEETLTREKNIVIFDENI